MLISLIFGLVLGGLTVIFALQNVEVITVTFMAWQITGSLALILLAAALAGAIICALLSIPEIVKDHAKFSTLKNQNKELEKNLADCKARVAELESKTTVTNSTLLY